MSTFDLENPNPKPGDGLRDEAANLLTVKYGRPFREHRAAGKKVDVFFRRSDFGKLFTIFLEAKDYERLLHRKDVTEIWTDYSGIVGQHAPASLLLITKQGLSADAQAFVQNEQPNMRHHTIWELENEVLGLTDYVRSLAELFDQDGLSQYYIPARAFPITYSDGRKREYAGGDQPLFEEIVGWIATEDYRPIAILGGYGAGKSSFAKRLLTHQAKEALSNPLARRPVLIALGEFARYSSLEGLLGGKFTHDFPIDGFNVRHFLSLSDKGRMLVVLDGFDEMKHAMTWADFRSQIAALNRLTHGRAKVLLLGRPSAFTSAEEHNHVLQGLKRYGEEWRRLPDWPEFREYELDPFSPTERAKFVRAYLNFRSCVSGDDWVDTRAGEVNRLADHDPEIFGKPVHAKILTDLAADRNVNLAQFADGVSRWRLYETFFGSLAEREMDKDARRPIGETDRLKFLREVAFWLWTKKDGATAFSALDLPDLLVEGMAQGDAPDFDALKREYLTGAFLEKKSGDIYYFGHRSFAEFLVAERMVHTAPSAGEQAAYSDLFRDGVELFLREAPDPFAVKAWADGLSSALGVIHLEYVEFIAEKFGGIQSLIAALPTSSKWIPILKAVGDQLSHSDQSWSSQNIAKLWSVLRLPDNERFFVVLNLLRRLCTFPQTVRHRAGENFPVKLGAALLDRVFETADIDASSGKASIEEGYEEARSLAAASLPEMVNEFGDRKLVLNGSRIVQLMNEGLRAAGWSLEQRVNLAYLNLEGSFELSWSLVLSEMSTDNANKATEYYRRNDSLQGVFIRARAPIQRHASAGRHKRRRS